ncbi:response regulator [Flavisolibacter ginsengisoli]|jgi:CheY-like chemotaxis protein|uniref:Response regulator receiver domain-containing protein n=1 Tax=Flavisolibacter ginsengisoli DSM 18119 TaxID=1121884 RepID=A0A1M4ZQ70_9BACT|nr:response regulator [Flavisolibacter ginsengisoli]SHF19947.1 Response regulator receiver domain-containing protein [Flavisolibacter ginsengisoli DSM 18119]
MPDKRTILLADDDIEDVELLQEVILSKEPEVNVHSVSNGKQVMEYLASCTDESLPGLIILDYNMPELTGSEVLSQMSEQPRYKFIPKLILSTSNAYIHMQECIKNGATEYFVKPNSMRELEELTDKMLGLYA